MGQYLVQINEGQAGMWDWLGRVLGHLGGRLANKLQATKSNKILYNPNMVQRWCRKEKARPKPVH